MGATNSLPTETTQRTRGGVSSPLTTTTTGSRTRRSPTRTSPAGSTTTQSTNRGTSATSQQSPHGGSGRSRSATTISAHHRQVLRSHWRPDSASDQCQRCNTRFKLLNRRHHCRDCGGLFCNDCSSYRDKCPRRGIHHEDVRLCRDCYFRNRLSAHEQSVGDGGAATSRPRRAASAGASPGPIPRTRGAFISYMREHSATSLSEASNLDLDVLYNAMFMDSPVRSREFDTDHQLLLQKKSASAGATEEQLEKHLAYVKIEDEEELCAVCQETLAVAKLLDIEEDTDDDENAPREPEKAYYYSGATAATNSLTSCSSMKTYQGANSSLLEREVRVPAPADAPQGTAPSLFTHVVQLPCGHVYHRHCAKEWLERKNECPLCKVPLPPTA